MSVSNKINEFKERLKSLDPSLKGKSENILDIIENKSGYIEIKGKLYRIETVHKYTTKNEFWHEVVLLNLQDLTTSYLEIYVDDVLELSICHESEKTTPAKAGISTDKVEEISEDGRGYIFYDGDKYDYDDDYKLKFIKNSNEEPIKFYTYEFESAKGLMLSIDEWDEGDGDYSYELFVSTKINEADIKLI